MATDSTLHEWSAAPDPNGRRRRWWSSPYLELIVWSDGSASPIWGFQLCYDRSGAPRALTWTIDDGFLHSRIDEGEAGPLINSSPILVADGVFPGTEIVQRFVDESAEVPAQIKQFVIGKVQEYCRAP